MKKESLTEYKFLETGNLYVPFKAPPQAPVEERKPKRMKKKLLQTLATFWAWVWLPFILLFIGLYTLCILIGGFPNALLDRYQKEK